jgi:hypothetical protein
VDINAFHVQFMSPRLVQDWAPLLRAVSTSGERGKRDMKNELPAIGPQLSPSSPLHKANRNREHREQ